MIDFERAYIYMRDRRSIFFTDYRASINEKWQRLDVIWISEFLIVNHRNKWIHFNLQRIDKVTFRDFVSIIRFVCEIFREQIIKVIRGVIREQ